MARTGRPPIPANVRFNRSFIVSESGCWEWLLATDKDGYGVFTINGKMYKAHRVSYFLKHGQWPKNTIDHLCRNRKCVNPEHLEDVTVKENTLRGFGPSAINSRSTVCRNGHPLDKENLHVGSGRYHRRCKTCMRLSTKKRNQKLKEIRHARGLKRKPKCQIH